MKKSIPLLLALVLLITACGAPSEEVTPSPTPAESIAPVETAEPAATLELPTVPSYYTQPRPVPEWLDFPDDGFTVENYCLAEPFGVCGRALLLTGTDGDGNARFKCRYASYSLEYNEPFGLEYFLRGVCVDESSARLEERADGGRFDADVLLTYGPDAELAGLAAFAEALRASGRSVRCERAGGSAQLRCRTELRYRSGMTPEEVGL